LEIHQARQPDGTVFAAIPQDNTTLQAQQIDKRRWHVEDSVEEGNDWQVCVKLNGTWVDVTVDIRSLRAALGLPQHNIFVKGIYHGFTHNETTGPDIADVDHGGVLEGDTVIEEVIDERTPTQEDALQVK